MMKKFLVLLVVLSLSLSLFPITSFAENDETVHPIDIPGKTHTQQHTVKNYHNAYQSYDNFLSTAIALDGSNGTPDLCIPGLSKEDHYIPQGATYCSAYNWIIIAAYDENLTDPSVLYALDYATGKFVSQFYLYRTEDTPSHAHMSGIACSDKNLYIADASSRISYIDLAELKPNGTFSRNILLSGITNLATILNSTATSYVSYSDGTLWLGNFFSSANPDKYKNVDENYNSILWGYTFSGETSLQEWENFVAMKNKPTFVIPLDEYGIERVQGAVVYNDTLYASISGGRKNNSILFVGDIDNQSAYKISVAGKKHNALKLINYFTYVGIPMSEAVFVHDEYLFIIYESAAYKYHAETASVSINPTDVLWKFSVSDLHDPSLTYQFEPENLIDNHYAAAFNFMKNFINILVNFLRRFNIFGR